MNDIFQTFIDTLEIFQVLADALQNVMLLVISLLQAL